MSDENLVVEGAPVAAVVEVPVKLGIESLKALVSASNLLAIEIIKVAKDGLQLADAVALMAAIESNESLKSALLDVYSKAGSLVAEVKDLDASEDVELAVQELQFIPQIIKAVKGE